jgi:hypothetical protein
LSKRVSGFVDQDGRTRKQTHRKPEGIETFW